MALGYAAVYAFGNGLLPRPRYHAVPTYCISSFDHNCGAVQPDGRIVSVAAAVSPKGIMQLITKHTYIT